MGWAAGTSGSVDQNVTGGQCIAAGHWIAPAVDVDEFELGRGLDIQIGGGPAGQRDQDEDRGGHWRGVKSGSPIREAFLHSSARLRRPPA